MNRLERFSTIFLVAGFISFTVAFLILGIWPAMMTESMPDQGLPPEVPEEMKVYYSKVDDYHNALRRGRDIYVKEACWHCHSQYIRPVSNESLYYGIVSIPQEYENELNLPQLFGTRRVGPDLVREAGKRSNDWHIAHFYEPKHVVPGSVMPSYSWYYDETTFPPKPTADLIALVSYVQYLGYWTKDVKKSVYEFNEVTMPPMMEE